MTKLKVTTTAELLRFIAEGVISAEEWRQLVEGTPPAALPDDITRLSLADYFAATATSDDYECCELVWRGLGGTWSPPPPPYDFLRRLHAVADGLKRVAELFEALPTPALSADEQAAGFGKLNFGVGGLIDRLARRQGMSDDEAKKMTINAALGKLAIDGSIAVAERKFALIQQKKTRR